MIPWYKRFYQVGKASRKIDMETTDVINSLKKHFGTSEEQKRNYSHWSAYRPFAIDVFWGNYFTIQRIAVSTEPGTRPMNLGTKISGQVLDNGDLREITFIASIRLVWFFLFIPLLIFASLYESLGLILGLTSCLTIIVVLRHKAKKDMQVIYLEINKALKTS